MKPTRTKHIAGSRRLPIGIAAGTALVALLSAGLAVTAQAAATSVGLGTAGGFAILAGSGMTNTGVTTIDGDVGSYPTTSQTGFEHCPQATGNCVAETGINYHGKSQTQQAKHDLTTAYNQAAGEGPPNSIGTIGAGQTLDAGVYNSATAIQLNGALTLDGQGNKDAVFVFQAGSTLTSGTTSSVVLEKGAQACNVFWQVGSSATLNTSTNFVGTILAYASISLGDTVTVNGRLLAGEQASGAGAVTLIHDTIIKPTCASTPTTTTTTTTAPGGTTTTTSPGGVTTTTSPGGVTTTTLGTHHGKHHGSTTTTTTASNVSPSRTPKGGAGTGGGSTAGLRDVGLFGLGGALLLGGAVALAYRRRPVG